MRDELADQTGKRETRLLRGQAISPKKETEAKINVHKKTITNETKLLPVREGNDITCMIGTDIELTGVAIGTH